MSIDKDSHLYQELILRSKIFECCSSCRHYSIRFEEDYCFKYDKWIYGCVCKKKKKYLARFGLSEGDLNWDVSFLSTTDEEKENPD